MFGILKSIFQEQIEEVNDPVCQEPHLAKAIPVVQAHNQINIHPENTEAMSLVMMAFRQAEVDIKTVELESYGEDLNIPSINELRYVGHHLCKAFSEGISVAAQAEEFKRAQRHAERASYDAIELGIIAQLEAIRDFQLDTKNDDLSKTWPNYIDDMEKVESAKKFILEHSVSRERENYFADCSAHYKEIEKVISKINVARPKVVATRKQERTSRILGLFKWLGVVLASGLFTLLLTVIQIIPYENLKAMFDGINKPTPSEQGDLKVENKE